MTLLKDIDPFIYIPLRAMKKFQKMNLHIQFKHQMCIFHRKIVNVEGLSKRAEAETVFDHLESSIRTHTDAYIAADEILRVFFYYERD